jgi:hypothetical protein
MIGRLIPFPESISSEIRAYMIESGDMLICLTAKNADRVDATSKIREGHIECLF